MLPLPTTPKACVIPLSASVRPTAAASVVMENPSLGEAADRQRLAAGDRFGDGRFGAGKCRPAGSRAGSAQFEDHLADGHLDPVGPDQLPAALVEDRLPV